MMPSTCGYNDFMCLSRCALKSHINFKSHSVSELKLRLRFGPHEPHPTTPIFKSLFIFPPPRSLSVLVNCFQLNCFYSVRVRILSNDQGLWPLLLVDKKTVVTIDNVKFYDRG